ncbi:MAG: PleD family two-component system response regulator [Hyphomicrobiales bacterium]|nr:MAG: PleD family two-component system response regulator [Hyphomicrobiales bacterium]
MSARILVVDDVPTNAKLLEARLTAEYFEVNIAFSGEEALKSVAGLEPDIILLDVMMPGMDGFEVCRRLKADSKTHHIPVIMVTALDQADDRVQGLEAGADDFLTKPVNDIALLARVKSLVRLKTVTDELRMRTAGGDEMTLPENAPWDNNISALPGNVLLVEDDPVAAQQIISALSPPHHVLVESHPVEAVMRAVENEIDLVIVSLSLDGYDGLRMCSQLRSLNHTRQMPIITIVEEGDYVRLARGLDLGVNDYIMRPLDENEMFARARTQLRRRRNAEKLRQELLKNIEHAVTDVLTGLHNRRYMETHMNALFESAVNNGRELSVLILDIDFFKSVNDTYGHDVGDKVLQVFARRASADIRGKDLLCRYGGEEFVVIMPDTDKATALQIAERMRARIADKPFNVGKDIPQLSITMSVGVGTIESPVDRPEDVLKRADKALYQAKRGGRNRVISDAA